MVDKQKIRQSRTIDALHQEKRLQEFLDDLRLESERAAVILAVAKLDVALFELLSKFLLSPPSSQDNLLDQDGPLSAFSSRINIAYRLGLIDAEFTRSLHLVRRIRNAFAHDISGCSLEAGPQRDRVRELANPFLRSSDFRLINNIYIHTWSGSAADFFTVVVSMLGSLEQTLELIDPVDADFAATVVCFKTSQTSFLRQLKKSTNAQPD